MSNKIIETKRPYKQIEKDANIIMQAEKDQDEEKIGYIMLGYWLEGGMDFLVLEQILEEKHKNF